MAEATVTAHSQAYPSSGWRKFWADYSESPLAVLALFVFGAILFIAVFAPFVSPTNPYDLATVDIMNSRLAPGSEDFAGNVYLLGTDGAGSIPASSAVLLHGWETCIGTRVVIRLPGDGLDRRRDGADERGVVAPVRSPHLRANRRLGNRRDRTVGIRSRTVSSSVRVVEKGEMRGEVRLAARAPRLDAQV